MNRLLKKNEILTIPNVLSGIRILLLPFIVWMYNVERNHTAAILLLLISGLTDIVDGFIARKFNMVSDFGKIIDPIADKLTQGTLLICLALNHKIIFLLIAIFVLKEFSMALLGYIIIKKHDEVNSAKWYGKLNTVVIYFTIVALIIFPNLPKAAVMAMVFLCIAFVTVSFVMYAKFYIKILTDNTHSSEISSSKYKKSAEA